MDYSEAFNNLKSYGQGRKKSPYKAVLLLAIIDMCEDGVITSNEVRLSDDLEDYYKRSLKSTNVKGSIFFEDVHIPYWYMQNEEFWQLIPRIGKESELKSLKDSATTPNDDRVKSCVEYAEIPKDLFFLMTLSSGRRNLRKALIDGNFKLYPALAERIINGVRTNVENKTEILCSEAAVSPKDRYKTMFSSLHISMKNGGAPHKPVLLLAIIEMFESEDVLCNTIYYDKRIEDAFNRMWDKHIGKDDFFQPVCWMPFLYMKHEEFWHFEYLTSERDFEEDFSIKSNRKESLLRAHVFNAFLDEELYNLLSEKESRDELRKVLIDTYINTRRPISKSDDIILGSNVTDDAPDQYKKHVENCDDIYIQYKLVYFKQLNVKKKRGILRTIAPSPVELYKLVHCDSSKIDTFHYKEKELLADLLKQIRMALDDYPTEVVALKQAISKAKNAPSTPVSQSVSSAQTSLELVRQIKANKEEKLRKAEEEKMQRRAQKVQKEAPVLIQRKEANKNNPIEGESITTPTKDIYTTADRPSKPFITHMNVTSDLDSRQKAVLKALRRFHEPASPSDIFRMVSWSEWGNSSLNADSVDSVLKTLREVQYIKWGKYILKEYLPEDVKENHGNAHSNSTTLVKVEKEEPKEYPSLYADEVEKINSAINEIKPFLVAHEIYKPSLYGSKWSREDDDIVKTHYSIGSSISTIAKILDRTIPSVIARLDRVCRKDWTMSGIERGEDGYFLFTEETIEIILHSWDCLKPDVIESMRNNHLIPLIGCHCTISLLSSLCRIKYE